MRISLEPWKPALAAVVIAGGLIGSASLGGAEAAPFAPTVPAAGAGPVTQAAYVCGPWGCGWRPGPRWGGYYGPRPVYGYGYRRCWWRPTPWGPRRVCRGW